MPYSHRYAAVAIALHWLIAAGIIFMILLGWNMEDSESLFQLHKSVGITILLLTVARIVWRLLNPPPALPAGMNPWEKMASHAVHLAFYGLMLLMPLTGWLLVSTAYNFDIPTVLYGLVSWPDIPGVGFLANEGGHEAVEFVHSKLAWVAIVLLGLHVAGAVKHEISAEEGVLKRMIPGLFGKTGRPSPPPMAFIASFGAALGVFVLIAGAPVIFGGSGPARPAPEAASGGGTSGESITANWEVEQDASSIRFSGSHDGSEYRGEFEDWSADIRFDPENLDNARVQVSIRTGSAEASKKLYTDSLKSDEWLAPSQYPEATVDLTNFRQTGEESYTAEATLNLKDSSVTVPFDFDLEMDGDEARMEGATTVKRTPLNLGQKSDPSGDWVGEQVSIEVEVRASRAD
ncbi:MAG: cytochrome b/b6 domain-containing protein [Henriciella sp.]|uniref:cytochrome b/b6 domain-containing protein n=1 Tax=Henriciella sp. TaxID=1968823 RepID=UPI0032EFDA3C